MTGQDSGRYMTDKKPGEQMTGRDFCSCMIGPDGGCMLGSHPGGLSLTKRLLSLAEMAPAERVLDLGAGRGESVRYLWESGYQAEGIDLLYGEGLPEAVLPSFREETDSGVKGQGGGTLSFGDMRALSFPDSSVDICLAECSISGCGDGPAAFREAFRVLKPGGSLLLSDVFFHGAGSEVLEKSPALSMPGPLGMDCWRQVWEEEGFVLRKLVDETPVWREFYLESLWNGNADPACFDFFREAGKAGCGYFLAWLWKGGDHGTI